MEQDKLVELATLIEQEIQIEFQKKHLSGNLMNTIEILASGSGEVEVRIPAEVYNQYLFFTKGVVVPTGEGSYASSLDTEGSAFMWYSKNGKERMLKKPRNHIGYLERAIDNAIAKWGAKNKWQLELESD